jgi:Ketopantoate reductase PanE/ApbA
MTFLVCPQRAKERAQSGLVIVSPAGNAMLRDVKTVLAKNIAQPFDLVLLSCKAYDLGSAILSFAPAVGPSTAILPLLNSMRHLDELDQKFGKSGVLGGQCVIGATLNKERAIMHLNDMHALSFGERDGGMSERVKVVATAMQGAKFDVNASEKSCRTCGTNGCSWPRWRAAGACSVDQSAIFSPPPKAQSECWTFGRVPRRRRRQRLCAAQRRQRTHAQDPHRPEPAHGVDAARHRKQRENRSRPYHR